MSEPRVRMCSGDANGQLIIWNVITGKNEVRFMFDVGVAAFACASCAHRLTCPSSKTKKLLGYHRPRRLSSSTQPKDQRLLAVRSWPSHG